MMSVRGFSCRQSVLAGGEIRYTRELDLHPGEPVVKSYFDDTDVPEPVFYVVAQSRVLGCYS